MKLPSSPSEKDLLLYTDPNRLFILVFNGLSSVLLTAGMGFFFFSHQEFIWLMPITIISTLYFILSFMIALFGNKFDLLKHQKVLSNFWDKKEKPSVDIFYPICGEDEQIVINAIYHIQDLAKGYGSNCHIYILDDSKNNLGGRCYEKSSHRIDKKNFHLISRPNKGEMKKAGNLRYAFERTTGEYIAIFDADFCPNTDFFKHTIPWMKYDKNIAILQTPQYFEVSDHETSIGKGAAYVQEFFYRFVQPHRDVFGGAICVGTNAIYRRKALAPFGGGAYVPHSEDVRTGVQCMKSNYKVKYLPLILAKGLCPEETNAFISQQHRWSLGSLSLFASKEEFWMTPMSFMQRACYLSGVFYYLSTGLSVIFQFAPAILLLGFYPEYIDWKSLIFFAPSLLFGTLGLALWSKGKWGFYFTKSRMLSSYAHLIAIYEFLTNSLTAWQPTGIVKKNKITEKFETLFKITLYFQLLILSAAFFQMSQVPHWYDLIPMIFVVLFDIVIKIEIMSEK